MIGYLFGVFKTGYFLGKLYNVDVRSKGSGNSGMTNTMRVMGKKVGIIAFLGDTLKCIIPIVITYFVFGRPDHVGLFLYITGLGAVLGDMFPFYLNFNGGKGVSSTAGIVLSLLFVTFDWKFTVLGLVVFFTTMFVTKYVSLASLTLMVSIVIETIVWGQMGLIRCLQKSPQDRIVVYIVVVILMVLSFVRHRSNIQRLINGTENKIGQKKEA